MDTIDLYSAIIPQLQRRWRKTGFQSIVGNDKQNEFVV